jgi:hypothetical protein
MLDTDFAELRQSEVRRIPLLGISVYKPRIHFAFIDDSSLSYRMSV